MYKKIIFILISVCVGIACIIVFVGSDSILSFFDSKKITEKIDEYTEIDIKIATTSKDTEFVEPKEEGNILQEKDLELENVTYDFMEVRFDESVSPEELAKIGLDSDDDYLLDDIEVQIGTDPFLADTDNDGLSDNEELMEHKTDPINPDTDGDGYLDGEEVEHGYDPLGV